MDNLKSFFSPKSLAVIGASRREGTLGKMFLDAIQMMNYKGNVYPINPKAESINELKCYADVLGLPIIPDLAIILLPKESVSNAVERIASKGIKNIIVISAGFKEMGVEGNLREQELINIVNKHDMHMIGPNSMGIFNTDPDVLLNATFSPTLPKPGHVGFISQSGALGVAVLELSKDFNLGFSCFVSTGNKADMGDADCLKYLAKDENTKSIILYQESIDKPAEFRKVCTEMVGEKPILALKSGRTNSGLKAASSHTGALVSDDLISDAFLNQCGIIRCDSLDELLEAALIFETDKRIINNRIAVVTNAGGPGILAADALVNNGLQLAEFSDDTIEALKRMLPAEASLQNPVDMIASANHETYRDVCNRLINDPMVDAIMVIIVKPPVMTTPRAIAEEICPVFSSSTKPTVCVLMAAKDDKSGMDVFIQSKTPVFTSPESASRSLGNLYRYSGIQKRFDGYSSKFITDIQDLEFQNINTKQAGLDEIFKLLSDYRLKICHNILTEEKENTLRFQKERGRVVLKIANEDIIHKSDLGLVKTDLSSASEVVEAFDTIIEKSKKILPAGTRPTVIVQEMIDKGLEFILGAKSDPQFGKIVMFGLGGIFVELYKDVAFRVLPIDNIDATQMIEELKGRKIIDGFRHYPAIDHEIIVNTIVQFSKMIYENPGIVEMDLNPIIWSEKDKELIIVDSRCTIYV